MGKRKRADASEPGPLPGQTEMFEVPEFELPDVPETEAPPATPPPSAVPAEPPAAEPEPAAAAAEPSPIGDTVSLAAIAEIPLGAVHVEQVLQRRYHCTRHVEVNLSLDQAIAMRRLWLGLDARGARLASGKRVTSAADAVRWLLERLA